jgi:nucleoid-associated protein YgaU
MRARERVILLLALTALAVGSGCGVDPGALSPEADEPLYREGQQLERQGRTEQALNAYLKLINQRGDQAPQSHLEAGVIYLDTFKDPIAAIYHFREYLKLEPNSVQAAAVRGQIDAARREFASTLPAPSWESGAQPSELTEPVERLQNENASLKAEIAALRSAAGASPLAIPAPDVAAAPVESAPVPVVLVPAGNAAATPAAPPAARPAAPAAPTERIHVVVKGDTLTNLAYRYYGSRARWRDIVAANRGLFPGGATGLKLGMQLKIPQ